MSKRLSAAQFDQEVLETLNTKRLTLSDPLAASNTSSPSISNSSQDSLQDSSSQFLSPNAASTNNNERGPAPSSRPGTSTSADSATRHSQENKSTNSPGHSVAKTRPASAVGQQKQLPLAPPDHDNESQPPPGSPRLSSASMKRASPATNVSSTAHVTSAAASSPKASSGDNYSTFSRTMRKTSGFFRKHFSTSGPQNAASTSMYSTSNRSTPSHSSSLRAHRSNGATPPVPPLRQGIQTDLSDQKSNTSMSQVPATLSRLDTQSTLSSEASASKSDEDERLNRVLRSVNWNELAEKLDDHPDAALESAQAKPTSTSPSKATTEKSEPTSSPSARPTTPTPPRGAEVATLPSTTSPSRAQTITPSPRRESTQSTPPEAPRESSALSQGAEEDEHNTPSIRLVPSHQPPRSSFETKPLPELAEDDAPRDSSRPSSSRSDDSARPALTIGLMNENSRSKESLLSSHTTRPVSRTASQRSTKSQARNDPAYQLPDSFVTSAVHLPTQQSPSPSGPSLARASTSSLPRSIDAPGKHQSEEEVVAAGVEAGQKCWNEDESFKKKHKMAEFLGSSGPYYAAARKQYISNFDLSDQRLDVAFRRLCNKLFLRAETQQVDRILEDFSKKYFEDNPGCVLPSSDVVHQVVYSILLLNTDLHVADVSSHMSSKQFIRNTMATIQGHHSPQLPQITRIKSGEPLPASPLSSSSEDLSDPPSTQTKSNQPEEQAAGHNLSDRLHRASSMVAHHSPEYGRASPTSPARSKSTPLPAQKNLDHDIETMLREIYVDIKRDPVFLPGVSSSNLSVEGSYRNANRRSQLSLVSSGGSSSQAKRNSVRNFLGHPSTDSTRASSPTPSTVTSLSDGTSTAFRSSTLTSATSLMTPPQTIGFASNLSHTIIKEQHENEEEDDPQGEAASDSGVSATDEELALMGAPWAKEGLLQRKHYMDGQSRRAKDKHWGQVFVVISKGDFRMFKFGGTSKGSTRGAGGLGGGNWLANAEDMGDIQLAQSLTCAMPPPGYSSSRRHVFVVTLPSQSSFFFQAGTDELVQEWVSTCNYWAARLSKEPLTGGVSNMEFGWNRVMPATQPSADDGEEELDDTRSVRSGKSNKSVRSARSGRSRFGTRQGHFPLSAGSSHNVNDRVLISEWKPPQPPSSTSLLSEDEQLRSLRRYLRVLQADLETHNEIRDSMNRLYSPKSPNATKSNANWEKKSAFLISEIVKYTTYINALEQAVKLRSDTSAQKAIDKMLKSAEEEDAMESLAALEGRRAPILHKGRDAGSFVDVTAPAPLMGDAPVAGMRRHKRTSTQSSMSFVESENHDSRSLAQTHSSAGADVEDAASPKQSLDTTF